MRLLGVDPGSHQTGFGFVDGSSGQVQYISSGSIRLDPQKALGDRLSELANDFRLLLKKYQPEECAVESLFFAKNAESALKLGHARGVLLMTAAQENIPIFEYPPTKIKSSVCGSGGAKKEQVAQTVKMILKLPRDHEFDSSDETDALAICLTHLQTRSAYHMKKGQR